MKGSFTNLATSGEDQLACTTSKTLRSICELLGVDKLYDPCPKGWDPSKWDGLTHAWPKDGRWIYVNPPFTGSEQWIKKIKQEAALGARVCLLLPYKPETAKVREAISGERPCDHLVMLGAIRFVGYKTALPCVIALYIWGPLARPDMIDGPYRMGIMQPRHHGDQGSHSAPPQKYQTAAQKPKSFPKTKWRVPAPPPR